MAIEKEGGLVILFEGLSTQVERLQAGGVGGVTETTQNIKSMSLPEKWTTTKLKDISEKITKGSTPTSYGYSYKTEGIKFIKAENIDENSNVFSTTNFIDEETNEFLKRSILHENDLLFSIAGTIGRTALIKKANLPANTNQALAIIRTLPRVISHKYLLYYLKSDAIQKKALKKIVGVGRANLSLKNVGEFEIPIASENEQKRIVAEIEKQLSRLDEAVDNLKRVKANLKRYKASVLKAAVEGKLTEEWREKHPDAEPADKLLERILAERRRKWEEAELARLRERAARRQAKMKAKGKVPKDDKWKKKYKKPDVSDQIDMELPNGWVIATIKQLTERVQYGSSSKTSEGSYGIPVLRMGNIFEGKLLLDKLKYLPESHDEFPELLLESGDLLFNRTNSPELVGKTAVYKGNPSPCSFASYLIRGRFISGVDPNFISYFISSNYGRKWIKSVVSQQVGQANVNGTKLQALSVPLPPYIEQNIIVSEVENKFSIIGGIEKEVDRNIIRAERLRQSILKKAFSGKLVSESKSQDN